MEVVGPLLNATARTYGVETKDMLSPKELAEELVKEVMDSNFISANSKAEFCTELTYLMADVPVGELEETRQDGASTAVTAYRQRLITYISAMMGLLVTTMTVIFTVFSGFIDDRSTRPLDSSLSPIVFALFAMLAVLVSATVALYGWIYFRRRKEEAQERKDSEERHTGTREDIFRSS